MNKTIRVQVPKVDHRNKTAYKKQMASQNVNME